MDRRRRRVLFIANGSIGDAVLSSGLVRRLVESEPEASFTIVASPLSAPLFAETPRLEQLIRLRKQPFNRHWLDLWRQTRGRRWSVIVDMRGSALAYALSAQKRRIYRPIRQAPGEPPIHKVLQAAAVIGELARAPSPFLYTSAAQEARAAALVSGGGPILALAPVAKTPAKTWPPERFAETAIELLERRGKLAGGRVLLTGAASDAAACAPIRAAFAPERVIDLLGLDLLSTYACLKRASLYIGNDSGLMHLSAAAGAPTLGLFSATDERAYRPWGDKAGFVKAEATDGAGGMATLGVETVARAALDLLARTRAEATDRDSAAEIGAGATSEPAEKTAI